jgi:hypothetical protein
MLMTTNPEKVPDTPQCTAGSASAACAPGFFDAKLHNRPAAAVEEAPHACCEGYFCPSMLTCMIPCPLGGYCPRCGIAGAAAARPVPDPSCMALPLPHPPLAAVLHILWYGCIVHAWSGPHWHMCRISHVYCASSAP